MFFRFGNMKLQGMKFIRQKWRMWIETGLYHLGHLRAEIHPSEMADVY